MQPVWGKVAGLWVGYDFALGHATIKVPLRYCSRMLSRQHTQSHSVLREGLPGCPCLLAVAHCWQPPGMVVVPNDASISIVSFLGPCMLSFTIITKSNSSREPPFNARWSEGLDSGFYIPSYFSFTGKVFA